MANVDQAEAGPLELRLRVLPGEEPWTEHDLTTLRQELIDEIARLTAEASTIRFGIDDVLRDSGDGSGDDQADTGSKAFEREQGLTLLAGASRALEQTHHAMDRLDSGEYGLCESCGSAIGKARLQAFARATLCVRCKQLQERR